MASSGDSSGSAPSAPSDVASSSKSIERGNPLDQSSSGSGSTTAATGIARVEIPPRSFSDPSFGAQAASNLSRNNSDSYFSSSGVGGAAGNRSSRQSLNADMVDEEKRAAIKKRYSGSSHTNIHTECGRHTDDWLVGPLIETVKETIKTITGGRRDSD